MDDLVIGDEKDSVNKKLKAAWHHVSRPFGDTKDFPLVYDDHDEYDFSHPSRGTAIIINNKTFHDKLPREGADVDANNLQQVFSHFGFSDIRYFEDLTAVGITSIFQKISKENYKNSDSFVCAVSSHGDEYFFDPDKRNSKKREEFILGTDLRPVLTCNILEMFNDKNCPSLRGKPRIFFMQACRGQGIDSGVDILNIHDEVDGCRTTDPYVTCPSPLFKDFLIVYSTPPGFASFRRPDKGSWFVSALAECVKNCRVESVSLLKLLTKVIHNVSLNFQSTSVTDPSLHGKKQAPCICSMLTKDVYFRTKK